MAAPGSRSRWVVVAAVALAAAAALLGWLRSQSATAAIANPAPPLASSSTAATLTAPAATPLAAATATPTAPSPTPPGAVPPGIGAEQWSKLQDELQRRPDGAAELRRVAAYLVWSDTMRRFRSTLASDPASAAALAHEVDAGLGERLAQREVSAGEAQLIKAAVLAATIADPAERAAELQRWQATGPLSALAAPMVDPRQAEFQRRQAAIVAAWSARPVAQRDRAALTRDLEALRSASFATPPAR